MLFLQLRKYAPRAASGIVLAVFLFVSSGCGTNLKEFYFGDLFGKKSTTDKAAEQLAYDGMQNMQKKKYGDAVKDFQKLKERYPYSKYAVLAELKLGDAYFYDGKYDEAALAYEEFVRLHPRNEVVPYVLYQYGMCHFLSFSAIDRDPSETDKAVEAFRRVIQNYPGSEYARRAQKQLFECEKRIVAHDYEVGKFYYRLDKYPSAKVRLERILKEYPAATKDLGYTESAEKMLAECEKEIAKGEQKPSIWVRMGF